MEPLVNSEMNGNHAGKSTTPPTVAAICEPRAALERLGGMDDLYAELVKRFLDDASGDFRRVEEAVAAGDAAALHRAAHTLKNLAGMCGAVSVAEVATLLEHAGSFSQFEDFQSLKERLVSEMDAARGALERYAPPTS